MKKSIWLNYDLSVGGDYKGLYSWLDDLDAIECGNGMAYFKYNIDKSIDTDKKFLESLQNDINSQVDLQPIDRVYIVFRSMESMRFFGKFIIGKRKSNPWKGYGTTPNDDIEEGA